MNLKRYAILFAITGILAVSCRTAGKLYEKGRYDEAVELAAKKLQKDPDDPKLLAVLQKAYRYAVEDHEQRIRSHAASQNELKWEWTYQEYASLQRLYESIRRSPEVFDRVNPADYSSYLVTYRDKAGEVRYDRGLALMDAGDKRSYREAYREFQAALGYIPGDIGIRRKMEEAHALALVNVVVMPLEEQSSYRFSSYHARYRGFDRDILRYLQNNNGNEFVRYYSAMEARSRDIRADQLVDIRFSSFQVGRQQDDRSTRTVSREVLVKETVYRPDSVVKEYAKVTARITTTKTSLRSEGLLRVAVRDPDGRPVWTEQYSGQHFWSTEFAAYTGDERALSETDKQQVNRPRQIPPAEEDIIRSIMTELQGKLECGIRDYYNRY